MYIYIYKYIYIYLYIYVCIYTCVYAFVFTFFDAVRTGFLRIRAADLPPLHRHDVWILFVGGHLLPLVSRSGQLSIPVRAARHGGEACLLCIYPSIYISISIYIYI